MKRIWGSVKLAETTTSAAETFRNPVPNARTWRFCSSGPPSVYPIAKEPRMKRIATAMPSRPRRVPAYTEKSLMKSATV